MKNIVGLDLGMSIGWAYVKEAQTEDEVSSIVRLGVRKVALSSDEKNNVEKGKAMPSKSMMSQQRRTLQRYKNRRNALWKILCHNGIISTETKLQEVGKNTTFQTYRFRSDAVKKQIGLEELARVLFMINKKRGYKSSRKFVKAEEGEVVDGIAVVKILQETNKTPGEYMCDVMAKGNNLTPDFYLSDLKNEFSLLWARQREFFPNVFTDSLRDILVGCKSKVFSELVLKYTGVTIAKTKKRQDRLMCYQWRKDALSKQLPLEEVFAAIGQVLTEISQSSATLSKISDNSKMLVLKQLTVGEYLYDCLCTNPAQSLTNVTFYRQDYEREFEQIWSKQAEFYPVLTDNLKKEVHEVIFYQRLPKSCKYLLSYCELEQKKVLLPNSSKEQVIGSRVCPKSSPFFQEFQVWQAINNIRVTDLNTTINRGLYEEEKNTLYNELQFKTKRTDKQILSLLFDDVQGMELNVKEVVGNMTNCAIYLALQKIVNAKFGTDYDISKMSAEDIYLDIVPSLEHLGMNMDCLSFDSSKEGHEVERQPYYHLWHLLYSFVGDSSETGTKSLVEKISKLTGLDEECAKVLSKVSFASDYASLSSKAIRKLLPFMQQGYDYSEACRMAGYNHSARSLSKEEKDKKTYKDHLDLIKPNSLHSPVVEKILNQVVNLTNAIIDKYGKPDEFRIELVRQLKMSRAQRENYSKAIDDSAKINEDVRKVLQSAPFNIEHPSRNDVVRYRLYCELKENGYKTLYSNSFISKEELFGDHITIEHIIPKALALDDSFSNKTLEFKRENIEKSAKTAHDFVSQKYGKRKDNGANSIESYEKRVAHLYAKHQISARKFHNLMMNQEDIPADFLNRDLSLTQYVTRKTVEILEELVPTVSVTTGAITSKLREDWKLVDVMQELNWDKYNALGLTETYENRHGESVQKIKGWTKRNDNRNHAMDALTIAFTKPSIVQYLNNLNAKSDKNSAIYAIQQKETKMSHGKRVFKTPMRNFKSIAQKNIEKILVSYQVKNKVVTPRTTKRKDSCGNVVQQTQLTPRGELHEQTVYGQKAYFDIAKKEYVSCKTIRKKIEDYFSLSSKQKKDGKNIKEIFLAKIENVIDPRVRKILRERLELYSGHEEDAFTGLDKNPIWHVEGQNSMKYVKVKAFSQNSIALRGDKDYVLTRNNHHVTIFEDKDGKLHEHVASFFEVVKRVMKGLSVVDETYNSDIGWKFKFSMKQNDYFIFANADTGFNPNKIKLDKESIYDKISPNLFRLQKMSEGDYFFRNHTDATNCSDTALKSLMWMRIRNVNDLLKYKVVKVRIDNLGNIVLDN